MAGEREVDHEEEDNYYTSMDYSHLDKKQQHHHHHHQFMKQQQQQQQPHEIGSSSSVETDHHASNYNINQGLIVDYMFNNNTTTTTLQPPSSLVLQQSSNTSIAAASAGFINIGNTTASTSLDRLSFAEVMQFADFGPKLALNQQQMITTTSKISSSNEETGIDPVYFLKFPVLSDRLILQEEDNNHHPPPLPTSNEIKLQADKFHGEEEEEEEAENGHHYHHNLEGGVDSHDDDDDDDNINSSVVKRNRVLEGCNNKVMTMNTKNTNNNRRKRPRSVKTSEEVESQRMTHIAVERNRRKQMNEHLRVLRSLMPGSYVQRGDQASIIGGAIEFVRELEQLLQCLESQKRRRLFGGSSTTDNNNVQNRPLSEQSSASASIMPVPPHQLPAPAPAPAPAPQLYPPHPAFPNGDQMNIKQSNNIDEFEVVSSGLLQGGVREETAENKSCLADVEVKVLGFDAMIKILSRRRPGQLLKTIAALEDLQLNILHTNITTIEQTVLYSFNVKVAASENTRFSAEDIASSVQQIFNFIHASNSNTNI